MSSVKSAPPSSKSAKHLQRSQTFPTVPDVDDLASLRTSPPLTASPRMKSPSSNSRRHKLAALRKSFSSVLSPGKKKNKKHARDSPHTALASTKAVSLAVGYLSLDCQFVEELQENSDRPPPYDPQSACFMRVTDLDLLNDETATASSSSADEDDVEDESDAEGGRADEDLVTDIELTPKIVAVPDAADLQPHFHHASAETPPNVKFHSNNGSWVALDTGGSRSVASPIAPLAVSKLVSYSSHVIFNTDMWTPDHKTEKLLAKKASGWSTHTFQRHSTLDGDANDLSVLVWYGSFPPGHYGSEIPCIRSAGIVPIPCDALKDLLVDSTRVKEYNSLSLGRTDLVTLDERTKVVRSESKPPLVRSSLVLTSLMHYSPLSGADGQGYILVTRGVHGAASAGESEILLGVNIIRPLTPTHTVMINVNHIQSQLVPLMVAKRIGVSAAANFFGDLRKLAKK